MDELNALKASIKKIWGDIPSEIAADIAALEARLCPAPDGPPAETPAPETK
jgi:hypothetical protein